MRPFKRSDAARTRPNASSAGPSVAGVKIVRMWRKAPLSRVFGVIRMQSACPTMTVTVAHSVPLFRDHCPGFDIISESRPVSIPQALQLGATPLIRTYLRVDLDQRLSDELPLDGSSVRS